MSGVDLAEFRTAYVGEADELLAAANRQLLLFYMNAEDHGWGFAAYDGTDLVSSYTVEWTDDIEADLDGLDLDALRRHLPELPAETWSAIEADLHPPDDDTAIMTWAFEATGNPGHRTAERLGLTRARWMSGAYLTHDAPDGLDPGVIRVERP